MSGSNAMSTTPSQTLTSSTVLVRDTAGNIATWLTQQLTNQGATNVTEQQVENLLANYADTFEDNTLPLSSITPDYESNKTELTNLLVAQNNPAWTIQLISETGTQLLMMIATAQTMNQLGIELALREAFIQNAQLASSIYASTIDMGIKISRSTCANCTVSLTSPTTITIPAYTQFSIGNVQYFNRSNINLTAATPTNVVLYQGTVESTTFTADGSSFQTYTFGNGDFVISNDDVVVTINDTVWSQTGANSSVQSADGSIANLTKFYSVGLWEYGPNDQVYVEYSTPTGDAVVQFGNGVNGVIPPNGISINIQYVNTLGSDGNTNLVGQIVSCSTSSSVTGAVQTASINGSDNLDPAEYKKLSPGMYSAKLKPVTTNDYNTFALNYNGVIDAVFQGQQQYAPNDTTQCMIVNFWILPSGTWTQANISQFINWLTGESSGISFSGANLQFMGQVAPSISVNVTLNIFCKTTANLLNVQSDVENAVNNLFKPRVGYLGTGLATSDINTVVMSVAGSQIDYFDNQFTDILPGAVVGSETLTSYTYLTLGTLTVNTSFSTRRGA